MAASAPQPTMTPEQAQAQTAAKEALQQLQAAMDGTHPPKNRIVLAQLATAAIRTVYEDYRMNKFPSLNTSEQKYLTEDVEHIEDMNNAISYVDPKLADVLRNIRHAAQPATEPMLASFFKWPQRHPAQAAIIAAAIVITGLTLGHALPATLPAIAGAAAGATTGHGAFIAGVTTIPHFFTTVIPYYFNTVIPQFFTGVVVPFFTGSQLGAISAAVAASGGGAVIGGAVATRMGVFGSTAQNWLQKRLSNNGRAIAMAVALPFAAPVIALMPVILPMWAAVKGIVNYTRNPQTVADGICKRYSSELQSAVTGAANAANMPTKIMASQAAASGTPPHPMFLRYLHGKHLPSAMNAATPGVPLAPDAWTNLQSQFETCLYGQGTVTLSDTAHLIFKPTGEQNPAVTIVQNPDSFDLTFHDPAYIPQSLQSLPAQMNVFTVKCQSTTEAQTIKNALINQYTDNITITFFNPANPRDTLIQTFNHTPPPPAGGCGLD